MPEGMRMVPYMERTPEQQAHDARLARRKFRYEIDVRGLDGSLTTIYADAITGEVEGFLTFAEWAGRDKHEQEEKGVSRTIPNERVWEVRTSWYIPDEEPDVTPDGRTKASPYL